MSEKTKYWTVEKSIEHAKTIGIEVSRPTLIKWAKEYKIGFQLGGTGGKWYLYPEKFKKYINGGKCEKSQKEPGTISIGANEEEFQKEI